MSKMTDYGLVVLSELARSGEGASQTARELSERTHVPLPSVSKLLKELVHAGFLSSHRGAVGGYRLARAAATISVGEVIARLEGPIGLTECSGATPGACDLELSCHLRTHWNVVNRVIHDALEGLTLEEISRPREATPPVGASGPSVAPLRSTAPQAPAVPAAAPTAAHSKTAHPKTVRSATRPETPRMA